MVGGRGSREVVHINVGLTEDGRIALQFLHQDASQYTTVMAREVAAKLIGTLEELHGEAIARAAPVPTERISIQEDVQMQVRDE